MFTPTRPLATPQSTRTDLTRRAARGYTPIRHRFTQVRHGSSWVGGNLGELVTARQPRALNAYLMLLMAWPVLGRREIPLEAGVWARALSPKPPAAAWPPAAMTRVWGALDEHGLIERSRHARLIRVAPRREDGGAAYTRPRPDQTADGDVDKYFILPDDYWTAGWHETLTLPGRAVLLILLHDTSARDEAKLPYDRAAGWYGVSPKTLQNGMENLRAAGLLEERHDWVEAPLSALGRTRRTFYSLRAPFSRPARDALQAQTKVEAAERSAGSRGPADAEVG